MGGAMPRGWPSASTLMLKCMVVDNRGVGKDRLLVG